MNRLKHIILLVYYFFQFLFAKQNKYNNNIVVGPLLSSKGGVNGHVINLQEKCKILVFPTNKIRKIIAQRPSGIFYFKKVYQPNDLFKCKVLHTHGDPWITKKIANHKNKKFKWVHSYHSIYFEKDWNNDLAEWRKEMNQINLEISSKADIKIAVSKWLQKYLKAHYNIDAIYIPNGVDTNKLRQIKSNKFIELHNITNYNLFVGDNTSIKNVDLYLKLSKKYPKNTFVLIGNGLTKKWLNENYKNSENVIALGPMPHQQTLEAIKDCARLIITSKSETLPTLLLEALYLEKVTLAPNNYGCMEIINDDRIGILYEPELLNDLSLKYEKAFTANIVDTKFAKKRVLEEYDWSKIAAQLMDIYNL